MNVVLKFPIPSDGINEIKIPKQATVLSAEVDTTLTPCIYVLNKVNSSDDIVENLDGSLTVLMIGTGYDFPESLFEWRFINTVKISNLMFHIFIKAN